MSHSKFDSFSKTEAVIEPIEIRPEITPGIQQTLSRLMGWFDVGKVWKFLRTDNQGRLLVSTAQVQTATTSQAHTFVTAGVNILAQNNNRRSMYIQNTGADPCSISFNGAVAIGSGIVLYNGAELYNDDYLGVVYAISFGGSFLNIVEF